MHGCLLCHYDLGSIFGRKLARKRPRNQTVQGAPLHRKGLSARNVSFWAASCNPATIPPVLGVSHSCPAYLLLKLSHFGHFQGLAVK